MIRRLFLLDYAPPQPRRTWVAEAVCAGIGFAWMVAFLVLGGGS